MCARILCECVLYGEERAPHVLREEVQGMMEVQASNAVRRKRSRVERVEEELDRSDERL